MKQFNDYKETGIEWTGKIPSEWEMIRVGQIFSERVENVDDKTFPPLSVTMRGIKDQLENVAKTDKTQNRKKVLKGDFVINSRSDRKGSSGLSLRDGSVSVINIVLEPSSVFSKYYEYLFKSYFFVEEFFRNGKGIHLDLWSTKFDTLKYIKVPLPEKDVQKTIVSFLDQKIQQVDSLIEKSQLKIKLFKKQRDSLINQCVTKGLKTNIKMKDSGVEWIGEIPSHWEIKPLKYLVKENQISLSNSTDGNYELDYIEISDVNSEGEILNSTHYKFKNSPSRCRRVLKKNDIFISTVRTYLKSIGYVDKEVKDLICSTGFSVLSPINTHHSKFIFYLFRSNWFISEVVSKSEGASYPSIQSPKLLAIKVLEVPNDEMSEIVMFLDQKNAQFQKIINTETKRIEFLKEYHQSLVSNVVTGKIDIRNEVI